MEQERDLIVELKSTFNETTLIARGGTDMYDRLFALYSTLTRMSHQTFGEKYEHHTLGEMMDRLAEERSIERISLAEKK